MKKIKAQGQSQAEIIEGLLVQLEQEGLQAPPNFGMLSPDEVVNWADEMRRETDEGYGILDKVKDFAEQQKMLTIQTQQGLDMAAKTKPFNYKKAQFDDMAPAVDPAVDPLAGYQDPPDMTDEGMYDETVDTEETPKWKTHEDLKEWLDTQPDRSVASDTLRSMVPESFHQAIDDSLEVYYEQAGSDEEKLIIAQQIFSTLPDLVKTIEANPNEGIIEAPLTRETVAFVNQMNEEIEKLATSHIKNTKPFNMSKTAQQKTMTDNVIMYNSDQTRIDPFLRQPISDWHIMERNKGFGLVVDDIWNIDWETIWRGTIMDKYSRPYRDKDGNWTGGYIQKRFEVDKWIPEENNYQLKPGQRRRPYIAESKSTEARLQAMRAKNDRGYEPDTDTSEPYNWAKEASTKKKS